MKLKIPLKISNFLTDEKAQVSIEFVILTGSVIVGAIVIYSVQGSIRSFANVTANWVEIERNITITKLTR